jgi:hypothetical protein
VKVRFAVYVTEATSVLESESFIQKLIEKLFESHEFVTTAQTIIRSS